MVLGLYQVSVLCIQLLHIGKISPLRMHFFSPEHKNVSCCPLNFRNSFRIKRTLYRLMIARGFLIDFKDAIFRARGSRKHQLIFGVFW